MMIGTKFDILANRLFMAVCLGLLMLLCSRSFDPPVKEVVHSIEHRVEEVIREVPVEAPAHPFKAIAASLETTSKARAADIEKILQAAFAEAKVQGVDPYLIAGLIWVESRFDHRARGKSGDTGLMQIIPKWHPEKLSKVSLYDVHENIRVGTMIIKQYTQQTGSVRGGLIRYNVGNIPNDKGRAYAAKVLAARDRIRNLAADSLIH